MDNIEIKTAFISPNPQWFFKDYSKKQYSKNRVIILGHKKNKYILNMNNFIFVFLSVYYLN